MSDWCKRHEKVECSYVGSLFVGQCNADNLVELYEEFVKQMQIDLSPLLHTGMDGPNINLYFENKLASSLSEIDTFFEIRILLLASYTCSIFERNKETVLLFCCFIG